MNFLFRNNRSSVLMTPPKEIPEYFFTNYTHFHVNTFSRFNLSFAQMLNNHLMKQSFTRFMHKLQLHQLFMCFIELLDVKKTEKNCRFDTIKQNNGFKNIENMLTNLIKNYKELITDKEKFEKLLSDLEDGLSVLNKSLRHNACSYISIYLKYFAFTSYSSIVNIDQESLSMLVGLFNNPHNWSDQIAFNSFLNALQKQLSLELYPQYLDSEFYLQYQLEFVNSGIHNLRLSDFLYYDEFFILFIEFMEDAKLGNYLSFLLSVQSLSYDNASNSSGESFDDSKFDDAIAIYSQYFVSDSSKYIGIPIHICNGIANKLCKEKTPDNAIDVDASIIFQDVFRAMYYFLEELWLPQFVICSSFQSAIRKLHKTIQRRSIDGLDSNSLLATSQISSSSTIQSDQISCDKQSFKSDNDSVILEPKQRSNKVHRGQGHYDGLTLGNIDDMGSYHSCLSSTAPATSFFKSMTSSDYQARSSNNDSNNNTSSSVSHCSGPSSFPFPLGMSNSITTNSSNSAASHLDYDKSQQSPDEIARQIIMDVKLMSLKHK